MLERLGEGRGRRGLLLGLWGLVGWRWEGVGWWWWWMEGGVGVWMGGLHDRLRRLL